METEINKLKAEVFDILVAQENLSAQIKSLDQKKIEILKLIQEKQKETPQEVKP